MVERDKSEEYREIRMRIPIEKFPPFDGMLEGDFPGFLKYCVQNYAVNNHEVGLYIKTMDNYLTLPLEEMKKIAFGYLKMCETTAYQLYSNMAGNNGCLFYSYDIITDNKNTIQKTFDEGFINMLKSLLNTRWRNNQILINKINVEDEKIFEKLKDAPEFQQRIEIRKTYINLFLTLFFEKFSGFVRYMRY